MQPYDSPEPPSSGRRYKKVMEAASQGALLVRCGARSTAGLLLDGGLGGDAPRPEGAFVLAPGLLLHGTGVDVDAGVAKMADRVPAITVVMRRGRIQALPSPITPGAVVAPPMTSPAALTSTTTTTTASPTARPPHPDDLAELPARLVAAWRWPALAEALPHVLAELRVEAEHRDGDEDKRAVAAASAASGQVRDLLSVFVVLQLQPVPDNGPGLGAALARACGRVGGVPGRGAAVLTSSAPLGAAALLGAVCRGVVAGRAPGGLLSLTDARAAPGSEGAGVFAAAQDDDDDEDAVVMPFAVVFSPLTWWRGEAVGFTLCVGLRRLLHDALHHLHLRDGPRALAAAEDADVDHYGLDRSVLLVRCAHMWGTGVVVDKPRRIVLTCAHVLAEDEPVTVFWGRRSVPAAVLWRSADGVPYDVAVLQLADRACVDELEALALDTRPVRVGEAVLAAGYPLFSERSAAPAGRPRALRPLVSAGEVSGWWPSSSSQILSTCCVQSGASGGPLLRPGSPRPSVVGVLVCNAQLGSGRDAVVYPHVNFALWAGAIAAPIRQFLATGDASALAGLQCDSASVQRQWKLQAPRMCKL